MRVLKKIWLHLIITSILVCVFGILFFTGNYILSNSITVGPAGRWKYNTGLIDCLSIGAGFCIPAYLVFIVGNRFFLKKPLHIKSQLPVSVLSYSIITLLISTFTYPAKIADPYIIKNLLVLLITACITPFLYNYLRNKQHH
jgi:hypothetical protein